MIRTGIKKLDEILGGGIRGGLITDIFGASSTGKTQLVLQIVTESLVDGGKIFYLDTTGDFRPERLVELLRARNLDHTCLDRITVGRPTNTKEQMDAISAIYAGDFSLVVIDNVTDLFSFEYSKEEQLLEKTTQFAKHMRDLATAAITRRIPIITVNMIRKIDQTERENMDSVISIFTHVKIKLAKKDSVYEGMVISNSSKDQFLYKITKEGLVEIT
jgi:DNA repair protein RAD51